MSAYELLPTPTYADAKGQVASALEFGLFVLTCDWTLTHKNGRVEHQYQVYSALRLEGIEAAARQYERGPYGLPFSLDARELLSTGMASTEERLHESSGTFVLGEVELYRPGS